MSLDTVEEGRGLVGELVHAFSTNIRTLRDCETLEAVVRQEYIDPFWKALGWDVANTAHRGPAEKDVVIEASVGTIEAQRFRSRRPDYLFRIDGFPRFIVEAKRPAVDLATDRDAIFQTKTYAWSAQIPFAILTDFEEFRLFDATLKPNHDEPERGVIQDFDLRYEDYPTQWDALWATFSRQAVAAGSLEQLLARIKKVRKGRRIRGIDRMLIDLRGSEPVDRAFLGHLEDYRERFARELYRENPRAFPQAHTRHGAAKLTEAAQRLIDRLVFIRICEDRDIAQWGGVRGDVDQAVEQRLELYPILVARFRQLDREYNGYLFRPHFTEELDVSGQLLADFIRSLYPPDGPYRFDAIADDLLGITYERFLGSVITVRRRRVEVEEKPEVRHAGGVYYTPRFVVETIIRRVVGPQLEDRTPLEVLELKILDPACGSGSFLIAAFQYLMDHCLRYFAAHPDAARVPATPRARKRKRELAFQDDDGQWHLAPDFKAAILTSSLHGVDIDAQAVEVTIMSLYLKMLEGKLPPNWQREWLENELLPPLDNNIRCGNSLLSQTDFDRWWEDKHANLFAGDQDTRFRMNPFDWTSHTRGFGRLLEDRSGFDAVIGNPPYIRVQELNKWAPDECEFYKWRYKSAKKGNYDIYVVFIERALELLAPTGLLGFICPHKFWQAKYGEGLRKIIADGKHLRSVIDFADQQVFRGGTTYTAIQVFGECPTDGAVDYARVTELKDGDAQCRAIDDGRRAADVQKFGATHPREQCPWVFVRHSVRTWLDAMRGDNPALAEITSKIAQGIVTSCDPVYFVIKRRKRFFSEATHREHRLDAEVVHPVLKGAVHMKRWLALPTDLHVLFPYEKHHDAWRLIPEEKFQTEYKHTWKYLLDNANRLRARESGRMQKRDDWYAYIYPKNFDVMLTSKVLVPSIATRGEYSTDEAGQCFFVGSGGGGGGGYGIIPSIDIDLFYLCGLLNSVPLDTYLKLITTRFHSGWYAYSNAYLAQLPIKLPQAASERRDAERISERVREIIDAKKTLQRTTLGQRERERLERQVEAHEAAIDELVCRLYGVGEIPDP